MAGPRPTRAFTSTINRKLKSKESAQEVKRLSFKTKQIDREENVWVSYKPLLAQI
jgi:hypothetical protein